MAGIGSAWGSREEMLHPRDRHGRFRKKWKMAASVVDALTGFLDRFQPHQFQSDQQAAQYTFNRRKAPWNGEELQRLHTDWDDANEALQAGEMDDTTKKFVAMMDRHMVETTDDLIVSQTVPTAAFGLTPQQAMQEDGGLEDLIGLEIADAGYSAANIGSELSHPPGSVTLREAVPKGTRVAYGGRSPNDRALIFDRDQPLVVTKVESDGRGGWYMLAIAGSGARTQGAAPVAADRTHGRRGAGLTPEQREARVTPRMSAQQRLDAAGNPPMAQRAAEQRGDVPAAPQQTPAPAAAPASPQTPAPPATGVPERQEPVLKESVGPGSPEGKSASDIARDAEAAKLEAENAPPPAPAPPTPLEFQEATRDLPIPTSGPQRNEWNKAHSGLAQGKRDPGDVLRELDTDIEENKRKAASATHAEKKDSLERNIQAQEQLADLIAEKYGVQRRSTSAPIARKAPAATPGAPSTARGAEPKVKAPEAAPDRRTKAQLLEEAGDAGRPRMTKDQLRKAIESKKGGDEAPKKAAPTKKAVPAKAAPTPEDAAEEAFKARVAEAGLPDRVADLKAMAKDQKIRGFSTMNKKQLQSALLGDEVKASNKIGVVPPAKMVPHLEAAKSDQDARALLEKHTLVDLKALAKERGIKLPSKGATKGKVTDMVLEDIRGPQTGIEGRTPDTSLGEDLGNLGYIDLPGANGNQISEQIAQVDGDDPDSLRQRRDDLEKLSKQFRKDGDKDAANMAQAAADAMGMRAQTISGVEEGAPPVKRVAKKAVPEVDADAPEVERPIEKMLKPELLTLAQKEGASVRPSWSKARILDEIKKNRRMDSSRGPETDEERLRRELGGTPGGAERFQGPTQGPLAIPDRAPTMEEAVPDTAPPAKKATKKAAKKAVPDSREIMLQTLESGERDVGRAADAVSGQLKETFGDTLRRTDAEELRQAVKESGLGDIEGNTAEEIFDNTIKKALEDRMRELGMLPEDPKKPTRAQKRVPKGSVKGPKADEPITTPGRREAFTEAWDDQGFTDDPSMTEVRDRIAAGELTHEEGVRRLESEIAFNEDEMSDLQAQLEGMAPEDRDEESGVADGIHARRAELSDAITNNRKAIKFLRGYAKDEAPVTRQDLEIKLDGPELAALQRADVDDLKRAAKEEGLGDIQGDDKDTVVQNIGRAVAAREISNREKEQRARDTQAEKDEKRNAAEAIAGIESVMDGSDRAVQARIRSQSKASKLSPALTQDLLEAGSDRGKLQEILDRTARVHGLFRIATKGENSHFDPETHEQPPGADLKKGDPITVLETGWRSDVQGVDVRVKKAKVTAGHTTRAEAPAAPVKKAAKFLPPLANGTPRKSFTNVEVGDVVKRAGSKGNMQRVVQHDRPTARGGSHVLHLEDGSKITGHPNTAVWLDPSTPGAAAPNAPEAPAPAKRLGTPGEVSARLNDIENPPSREEAKALLEDLNGRDIRPMARELHIPTSGKTNDQIRDEIIEATSGRLADAKATRGFGGATPTSVPTRTGDLTPIVPAKKVAKAAVPAKATPPPVVDLDNPTKHNVEVIGTGLDLDAKGEDKQWLAVVQKDLDNGVDGRQIADGLRRGADSERTLHNIEAGAGGTDSDTGRAARINRMELMADRLEGVRPIPKPEAPKKAAADAVIPFDTYQAAQAASRARGDLRAGKSHTEVATALRTAATAVGSRDHDPTPMSRVGDPTPSEKTAMKRGDARKLRELAAEIQAEGVAQRAAAKAAKKAPAKKAAPGETVVSPAVDRMVRQGGTLPGQNRRLSELREAAASPAKKAPAKKAKINPNLSGLSDDELRKILASDQFPQSQKDAVQGELDARARKNLTGVTGELIKAQLDDSMRRLQEADTPEAERSALTGLLRPELAQLAKRLGLKSDRAKSVMINEIIDRVKGREAPTTSAERAVPKVEAPSAGAVDENVPLAKFPHDDNMRMHGDSPTMQLAFAYEKAGRNGSANRMAKLRARTTTPSKGSERLTPQQLVEELRAMRAQETDPRFQRMLDRAIEANDAPMTPLPEIPADTPPLARQLLEDLHAIPYARKGPGSEGGSGLTHGPSLVDQLAEVYRDAGRGERGPERRHPVDRIRAILRNKIHELNDPSFRIWEMTSRFESDESSDTGKKVTELEKEIRDWERSHWPK